MTWHTYDGWVYPSWVARYGSYVLAWRAAMLRDCSSRRWTAHLTAPAWGPARVASPVASSLWWSHWFVETSGSGSCPESSPGLDVV